MVRQNHGSARAALKGNVRTLIENTMRVSDPPSRNIFHNLCYANNINYLPSITYKNGVSEGNRQVALSSLRLQRSKACGALLFGFDVGSGDLRATILSASPFTTKFALWVVKMSWPWNLDVRNSSTMRMMTRLSRSSSGWSMMSVPADCPSIQQCRSPLPWRSHPEIDRPTLHPVSIAAYAYLMQQRIVA